MSARNHYYATYNYYGRGTIDATNHLPFGNVQVFDTRAARDNWVLDSEDYRDYNCHTEPVTSADARRMMVSYINDNDPDAWKYALGAYSMSEVVDCYLAIYYAMEG